MRLYGSRAQFEMSMVDWIAANGLRPDWSARGSAEGTGDSIPHAARVPWPQKSSLENHNWPVPLTAQDVQWVEAGIRRDYSVAAQVAGMVLLEGTEDEPIPESSRIWRYVGLVQQRAPASKQPGISSICAHLAGLGVHRYRTVPAAIPVRPDNADQQEWDARFARVWLT